MIRHRSGPVGLALLALAGCLPGASEAPAPTSTNSRPADRPTSPAPAPAPATTSAAKISWDTDRDKAFAEFLRAKSAGMIKEAAVGIERKGELRVELDRSVEPDDTLGLTKSLMAGARKDFPGRMIELAVYDPGGKPILKAIYQPGQGVHYKIANQTDGATRGGSLVSATPTSVNDPLFRSGVTDADRKFCVWAEEHGKAYLRYVEADLETHGRLWFGVTDAVKPADVPELTRSLLEGARKEFPKGEIVATVFDPEGERIGKAHLASDGQVRWER